MTKISVSINDEVIELTGKEAEDFEKDRAAQHAEFLKKETEKEAAQAALEAKKQEVLSKLNLTIEEINALLS